jgi:hypothetical protein
LERVLNNINHYQKLYQNKLTKRVILEFIFGFVVMYLGCKIHPTSLLASQPIYLSTAVVFALYSIRGYRITAGLLLGGTLAYFFSDLNQDYAFYSTKLLSSVINTTQILFCAFFIRYMLDKLHMALVSMRNLKEILSYIILSILVPQVVFNLLITPSIELMITGLGHTLGLLTISPIFLVWDAYVPKLSPSPQSNKRLLSTSLIWILLAVTSYLFCYFSYTNSPVSLYIIFYTILYITVMIFLIAILSKISNRFFNVIGMGAMGLMVLFYAISNPENIQSHAINTAYVQFSVIFVSTFWLGLLSKL